MSKPTCELFYRDLPPECVPGLVKLASDFRAWGAHGFGAITADEANELVKAGSLAKPYTPFVPGTCVIVSNVGVAKRESDLQNSLPMVYGVRQRMSDICEGFVAGWRAATAPPAPQAAVRGRRGKAMAS
jgi:hypothetical protein